MSNITDSQIVTPASFHSDAVWILMEWRTKFFYIVQKLNLHFWSIFFHHLAEFTEYQNACLGLFGGGLICVFLLIPVACVEVLHFSNYLKSQLSWAFEVYIFDLQLSWNLFLYQNKSEKKVVHVWKAFLMKHIYCSYRAFSRVFWTLTIFFCAAQQALQLCKRKCSLPLHPLCIYFLQEATWSE